MPKKFIYSSNQFIIHILLNQQYSEMEKTPILKNLNNKVCQYFQRFNYGKKQKINCFEAQRDQLRDFYSKMSEHINQQNLSKQNRYDKRNLKINRVQSQIQISLKNPQRVCLPKKIKQNYLINTEMAENLKMGMTPMLSEVSNKQKNKYLIAKEIKKIIYEDIQNLMKEKEQTAYRKKYPTIHSKMKNQGRFVDSNIEQEIKEYNRILNKFKESQLNNQCDLSAIENENELNDLIASYNLSDQKFNIISLFKKMYTKINPDEAIAANLFHYLANFSVKQIGHRKQNSSTKKQKIKSYLKFTKNSQQDKNIQKNIETESKVKQNLQIYDSKMLNHHLNLSNKTKDRSKTINASSNKFDHI